jgi:hypothetical protein
MQFRARADDASELSRYIFCAGFGDRKSGDEKREREKLRTVLPRGHGGRDFLLAMDSPCAARMMSGSTRFNDIRRGCRASHKSANSVK